MIRLASDIALIMHVLSLSGLTDEQLDRLRSTHRHRVMEWVSQKSECFKEKLSILKLTQDLGSSCQVIAKQFLSDQKGHSIASQLGETVYANGEEDLYDLHGLVDEVDGPTIYGDGDGLEDSFQMALRQLLEQVGEFSAAADALAGRFINRF